MKHKLLAIFLIFSACESKTGTGASVTIGGIAYRIDQEDRDRLQYQSPKTLNKIDNGEPLSTSDVKKMSKAGLSDNVNIDQIKATKSVFHLSTADIIDLKKSGVSQKVIDYMINTGNDG
jgi:hypothetical protein